MYLHKINLRNTVKIHKWFRKTTETSVKIIFENIKLEIEIVEKNKGEIAQRPCRLVNYYRACMYSI